MHKSKCFPDTSVETLSWQMQQSGEFAVIGLRRYLGFLVGGNWFSLATKF